MIESRQIETGVQTEAQNELLSYWASICEDGQLPKRGAFDPGAVLRYLRDMTILELAETGQIVCRIESGAVKARLSASDVLATRRLGLDDLLNRQHPVLGTRSTTHGTHHWLRLPLLSECGQRLVILCHDEFVIERGMRDSDPLEKSALSTHSEALAA
ncbi:MAG: PAS domain-containing protein [Pseudomonadota bacterium]